MFHSPEDRSHRLVSAVDGVVSLQTTEVIWRSLAFGTLCSSQGAVRGSAGFLPEGRGFR
jgi:hypothetical protein